MTQSAVFEYRVRVLPAQHELDVTLRLQGALACRPLLATPTWVPGAYGFMKYGRDLFDVRAVDAEGRPVAVTREGWSGFRVEASSPALEVRWRAAASDPAWGELSGLVAGDRALLRATRFLHPPGYDGPCRVRWELPEGWAMHHPDGPRALGEGVYEYRSFLELLESPVVAGSFDTISREADGARFDFVFLDRAVGFERRAGEFADAVMRVAEQCRAVFGSFPFERYSFILSFAPEAKWGLEHAGCTTCGLGPELFVDPAAWFDGVRVCAHELFHAWNACRLKPAPLERPDLLAGSFPDALWVTEGFTRYYEFVLCARAGAMKPEDFFGNLVNFWRQHSALPASRRVALTDSSAATFLNHNRFPGSVNAAIDYYDAGMLAAFDLDVALRLREPAGSLDEIARALFERHAGRGDGLTHAQARQLIAERAPELSELVAREIERPGGLSTPKSLARLGFEAREELKPYLGIVLAKETGPQIADVLDDSPAAAAGLAPCDEIERVAGHAFSAKALRWLIDHEARFAIEVRRGQRRLELLVEPGRLPRLTELRFQGDGAQRAALEALLGQPWPLQAGQSVPLTAHHNFHGLQTVW